MAKFKNTKTELKAQSDALKRFERFLPMLQLKKQQLQMEIAIITAAIEENDRAEEAWKKSLDGWIGLFASAEIPEDIVKVTAIHNTVGNIAGVPIPIFNGIDIEKKDLDLFATPAFFDDVQETMAKCHEFHAKKEVLTEQRRLITEELRITTQRVNLFEKIKIPEIREIIRRIRIHLGDESTAAVARGKIAKKRTIALAQEGGLQ